MWLAVDLSSEQAGLAVLDGNTVVAERSWTAVRRGPDPLFDQWRQILMDAAVAPDRIDGLVVGLGPGNYTGLRTALAAARLWALPGNLPVMGVGSALAMALAAVKDHRPPAGRPIAVVGDARRDSVWMTVYPPPVDLDSVEQPTTVIPRREWPRMATPAVWISADWQRFDAVAEIDRLPGTVVRSAAVPSPVMLGRVAWHRYRHGLSMPSLQPVYLQPAVSRTVDAGG